MPGSEAERIGRQEAISCNQGVFRNATHGRKLLLPGPDLLERVHRIFEHPGRECITLGLRPFTRQLDILCDVSDSALLDGADSAGIKLFESESRVLHFFASRIQLLPCIFRLKSEENGHNVRKRRLG